jgi:hypothetical protein
MKFRLHSFQYMLIFFVFLVFSCTRQEPKQSWSINDLEYLETRGLSVLAFHNFYPSGKQGGIEIIHHGERIATNGFIRMERVEGRRFPDPEGAEREIDLQNLIIKSKVEYEDFDFRYDVSVIPENENIRLTVDLDKPIPSDWEGKLNFAMEFFPPLYIGKTYQLGKSFGTVPLQANGPLAADNNGNLGPIPLGRGKICTLAGEDPLRKIVVESLGGELELVDDRNSSGRGWLLVKATIPAGVSKNAVEWVIRPNVIPGWTRDPMIAISQVGYHPDQKKKAIIELDPATGKISNAYIYKMEGTEGKKLVFSGVPEKWGKFLRYDYAIFDFTSISEPGMYIVQYGDQFSNPFAINTDVFKKDVWQPTLEGYFPIQMCHMEVRDRAAIWHGACHLDDALQAPLAIEHTDSYRQYEKAETDYLPLTTVPFLNRGGWHDAGDDDLAAGSQATTTHYLALSNEIAEVFPDQTSIDFENLKVRMRRPDGIPDMVQQVKHGAINLLSGYRAAGHSFAGIIATREGRNQTGDWASQSDQMFYNAKLGPKQKTLTHSSIPDDRWVFTNRDTGLEYQVAAALIAASRVLKGYDDELSAECLETAIKVWEYEQGHEPVRQPNAYVPRNTKLEEILATVELLYTTKDEKYQSYLIELLPDIKENISRAAWGVARVTDQITDEKFTAEFSDALEVYKAQLDSTLNTNPFGVPWNPRIWGVGWDIQRYALEHFFLVKKYPDLFDRELILRVVNYVLGCHPGSNVSLVSGVGAHSVTIAFGVYRDWNNYIPGGMVSGTALIRPDFPELKETTPYLWQQSEYVMPGAGSYIFCVLAADRLLND